MERGLCVERGRWRGEWAWLGQEGASEDEGLDGVVDGCVTVPVVLVARVCFCEKRSCVAPLPVFKCAAGSYKPSPSMQEVVEPLNPSTHPNRKSGKPRYT